MAIKIRCDTGAYLEYLMTPGQAELAALMPMKYEESAKKLGMSAAAVKKEIEGL